MPAALQAKVSDASNRQSQGTLLGTAVMGALSSLIVTACVNFVNLATAQALNRSKEVGIRKVLGSLRTQLFWQFIAETAIITCIALVLAIGMARLSLPLLNQLLNTRMELHLLDSPWLAIFLALLMILVIFLSGSYPGLVLARFQPILALRNKISQASVGGFSLRRILVVTQFAICQMLIIGAIVIGGQMYYSKNVDMGFDKDAIVTLPLPIQNKIKMNTLRDQIAAVTGVEKLTLCHQPPASGSNSNTSIRFEGRAKDEPWDINMKSADDQYLKTFGLQLVAGRNFFPSDTTREFVVNETVAKKLGFTPQQLIGHRIAINGSASMPVICPKRLIKVRRVGSPFSQASTSAARPAWKSRRSRSFMSSSLFGSRFPTGGGRASVWSLPLSRGVSA